jgi:hypothetical protein
MLMEGKVKRKPAVLVLSSGLAIVLFAFQNFTQSQQNFTLSTLTGCEDAEADDLMSLKRSLWQSKKSIVPQQIRDQMNAYQFPVYQDYFFRSDSTHAPRNLQQNFAGSLPGFWLATSDNATLDTPQVYDFVRAYGADVVVLRPNISYSLQIDGEATSRLYNFDYLYKTFKEKTALPSSEKIVLGYGKSTKSAFTGGRAELYFNGYCPEGETDPKFKCKVDEVISGFPLLRKDRLWDSSFFLHADSTTSPTTGFLQRENMISNDLSNPHVTNMLANVMERTMHIYRPYDGSHRVIDGIATDTTRMDPRNDPHLIDEAPKKLKDLNFVCAYQKNLRDLFKTYTNKMGTNAFILFNGMEPATNQTELQADNTLSKMRDSQERLLQRAHGAAIEFFGGYESGTGKFNKRSFAELIDQVRRWRYNPDKVFIVSGRGPQESYISFDGEYQWARYLYGAYLLGSGRNTNFHYHSTYQYPNYAGGRTDALQVYDFQLIDLGMPLSRERVDSHSGLYFRTFEKGLVVVNPYPKGQGPISMSTPTLRNQLEAIGLSGTDLGQLTSESSIIISKKSASANPAGRILDFTDPEVRSLFSKLEGVSARAGTDHLSFSKQALVDSDGSKSPSFLHDILISPIRRESNQSFFAFEAKLLSQNPRLLLVAEVDDNRATPKTRFLTFELGLETGDPDQVAPLPFFRGPTRQDKDDPKAPKIKFNFFKKLEMANQMWTYGFDPVPVMRRQFPELSFRRWHFMRPIGQFDIKRIQIGDSNLYRGAHGTSLDRESIDRTPEITAKRGLIVSKYSDSASLKPFENAVSWFYNYSLDTEGHDEWANQSETEFVPMLWGRNVGGPGGYICTIQVPNAELGANQRWCQGGEIEGVLKEQINRLVLRPHYLLAFNEPWGEKQSNLNPNQAALAWVRYVEPAAKNLRLSLVSPTIDMRPEVSHTWFAEFLKKCVDHGCDLKQIKKISLHLYQCQPKTWQHKVDEDGIKKSVISLLNGYKGLNWEGYIMSREIWVTETNCNWEFRDTAPVQSNSEACLRMTGQEVGGVPTPGGLGSLHMLSQSAKVERFSWFAGYMNCAKKDLEDQPRCYNARTIGDDGLPTPTGRAYIQFPKVNKRMCEEN